MRYFGWYCHGCRALQTSSLENLELFLILLNEIGSNLSFTMEVKKNRLCFLDWKLTLDVIKIKDMFYSKPAGSYLYLQVDSCHHLLSILGIRKGVALRFWGICSTDKVYSNN